VVTTQLFAQDDQALRARVLMLERRVQLLVGIVRLLFTLVRLCDVRLGGERVPTGDAKARIIAAVAANLAEQRARARRDRLASNRALSCGDCELGRGDHLLGSKSTDPVTALPWPRPKPA
jgi:hypothetical protein